MASTTKTTKTKTKTKTKTTRTNDEQTDAMTTEAWEGNDATTKAKAKAEAKAEAEAEAEERVETRASASAREGERSPPPNATETELENEEVRNILRQPRYFDDDYEAAALRCFRCGQGGHREVECELPAKKKACHLCGFKSHVARDCPHGLCFNCLTPGHQSRDCPYVRGSGRDAQKLCCLRCGKSGHVVTDCVYRFDASDLSQISCYVCGSKGHLCCAPQDAMPPGVPSCCRCGGEGHLDSACAHSRRGIGGSTPSAPEFACFQCGERGHVARDCPTKSRGYVDFTNAPTTFNVGSSGIWRGAVARGATHAPTRGYAAKYGTTGTGSGYRAPTLGYQGDDRSRGDVHARWTGASSSAHSRWNR